MSHHLFAMSWGTLTLLGFKVGWNSPVFWFVIAPLAFLAGMYGPRIICGFLGDLFYGRG